MADYSQEYFNRTRREMLPFVPVDSLKILDIGCAQGNFGAILRERNQAEVWGIELDPQIALVAANRLDRVIVGSIESSLPSLADGYFDCIVCNDILEHLADPELVLSALRRVLSRNGVLVGSMPNVRYFPVLLDLVWNGDWQYADYGVLDRTHLRFFTRKSLERTLLNSGYRPLKIVGINSTPSLKAKLANILSLGRLSDSRYLQFAFVAHPTAQ